MNFFNIADCNGYALDDIARGYVQQINKQPSTPLRQKLDEIVSATQEPDQGHKMDKQIRKIEKKEKVVAKDLKKLESADKKRDKVCDMGEKAMKMKKKK